MRENLYARALAIEDEDRHRAVLSHALDCNYPMKEQDWEAVSAYTFPTYVNSIAIGKHNDVYTLARFIQYGKEIEDLVIIDIK